MMEASVLVGDADAGVDVGAQKADLGQTFLSGITVPKMGRPAPPWKTYQGMLVMRLKKRASATSLSGIAVR